MPETPTIGLLVHGNNHFIVRGPLPPCDISRALVRQWSLIRIGALPPTGLDQWRISDHEFRENLSWAVIVPGDSEQSPAVTQLLGELSARGIRIHDSEFETW